jgi:hypothetical protein
MPWQNEMVKVLRYLINDLDFNEPPTYDDTRLEETILVSAQLTQADIDFANVYQIDVEAAFIYPDPTTPARDDGFINLVSVQAALLILSGELKDAALTSVKIEDGPSTIDFTDVVRNKKFLYNEMKDRLSKAKMQYRAGNSVAGQAILSPYTYDNLYASYSQY